MSFQGNGWQPSGARPNQDDGREQKRQRIDEPGQYRGVNGFGNASSTSTASFPPSQYSNSHIPPNLNLPNGTFSQSRPPSLSQTPFANGTPQTAGQQTPGVMGPPQRPPERVGDTVQKEPEEKHLDINDLSDLVTSSGIDIRKEEELMAASYRNERFNQSFGSSSTQPTSSQTSFDLLNQGSFASFANRGALHQAGQSKLTPEEELDEKHRQAARDYNERFKQHTLYDPFLLGNGMRFRMERLCNDNGLKLPMSGLYDKIPPKDVSVTAAKGTDSAIIVAKAPSILNKGAPLDSILSLLSHAANERLRGLLEDAYGLARGRQMGSDGAVPSEWTDMAADAMPPADSQPQKTSGGSAQPMASSKQPTNRLVAALQSMTRADREAEKVRLKKREERKKRREAAANAAINGETIAPSPDGVLSATTGNASASSIAPEPTKMTKKEREQLKKADVTEEQQTKAANTAAAMALGRKSKYSWLTKGAPGGGGSRSGTSTPGPRPGDSAGTTGSGGADRPSKDGMPSATLDRKFGTWREDGVSGRDVQLRDWVNVLESDGHEKKALAVAMLKLGKETLPQE